jgi:sigma-E factor negative regulatory protein RseA
MKPSITTSELLSALADGQLHDEEFEAALDACRNEASALDCWNSYHLIGDVLRSPANPPVFMAADAELAFIGRLSKRLAQESPIRPPLASVKTAPAVLPEPVAALIHHRGPASNDGNFRWKLVAGVASLAAVCAIAWNASGLLVPAFLPQLAQAFAPQIVVASPQGPVVRDARLQELLAAHKQFGATSAFQESSGFLRNATFEMPQEAQAAGGH